ncbi:MAG: VCBS repeat-containing protein [Gemmatimonadaceae bacterium]
MNAPSIRRGSRSATSRACPNVDWRDPNLKLVDLTGDGLADIVISEDDVFLWHRSLGEVSFAAEERVQKALDEERGPRVVFADSTETVFLSDLSGDGLADIVRIRNGEVCYWPNLGYGRFGAKVSMDGAPCFEVPDLFDPQRIRLADIDGSGTTDIVYLGNDSARAYFNQSGNGWSQAVRLPQLPSVDQEATVQVMDLLGIGTACRFGPLRSRRMRAGRCDTWTSWVARSHTCSSRQRIISGPKQWWSTRRPPSSISPTRRRARRG